MRQRAVVDLLRDHYDEWAAAVGRAQLLDRWANGDHELPLVPDKASPEYRELLQATATPWGMFMISAVTQALEAKVHRNEGAEDPSRTFTEVWRPNGLLSKQGAIYRGALGSNQAFVTTLPGRRPYTDAPTVKIQPVPATQMVGFYDPDEPDFPMVAIRGQEQYGAHGLVEAIQWRVYDETAVYYLSSDGWGNNVEFIDYDVHDVGVTPVHAFAPWRTIDGRCYGQIQPFMSVLRRLDQGVFDRLIVQRFNSWRTRTVAGLAEPETDSKRRAAAAYLGITDLLISEDPDTKFGTLEATDMNPFVEAHNADLRDLAATSQTPPHHLLGQAANLSADALVAAEGSLMRKVDEIQRSFGQTWDQVVRSSAFIMHQLTGEQDYLDEALDYESSMRWKDLENRSLAQTADALGKLADQLNIPVQMLWEQLPFWEREDTARARQLLEEAGADSAMINFLDKLADQQDADIASTKKAASASNQPAGSAGS